ncbi:dual specificity protein phosphatase PHS1 isoform X2 [Tanacetum coccineum]
MTLDLSRSNCVAILEDAILITVASSLGRNSPLSLALNNAKNTTPPEFIVTVNSGGVVFFALFKHKGSGEFLPKEEAAVIKIASSRMATQSERLGCEFAKWLGVRSLQIKEAVEKAREVAVLEVDEVGEVTCLELLKALELSRCLYLMNYAHGSPLLENSSAFKIQKAAEKTFAALGRILIPRVIRALQKDRRSTSVNSRMSTDYSNLATKSSDLSNPIESPLSLENTLKRQVTIDPIITDFDIVAIDSGVPRKPTAGKCAHDQESCPKLVELLLNSPEYASNLLHEITTGKLGVPPEAVENSSNFSFIKDMNLVGTLSRWLCEI